MGLEVGLKVGHKAGDVSCMPSTKRILVRDCDDGFGGTSFSARHGPHLGSHPAIPPSTPSTRMAENKENILPVQEHPEGHGSLQSRGLSHSAPSNKIKGTPSSQGVNRPRGVLQSLTPNAHVHLGEKEPSKVSIRTPLQRHLQKPLQEHLHAAHHNVPIETEDASKVNIGHHPLYNWSHPGPLTHPCLYCSQPWMDCHGRPFK